MPYSDGSGHWPVRGVLGIRHISSLATIIQFGSDPCDWSGHERVVAFDTIELCIEPPGLFLPQERYQAGAQTFPGM